MSINNRPFVISIAGMDPSAGAGVLADVKTFETLGCYGLAVNTANTVQTDKVFETCQWNPEKLIFQQLDLLLERFHVEVVKIGIIENLKVLERLLEKLQMKNKEIKIIWDPVIRSSSGFAFQDFQDDLDPVLEKVYLVTPNTEEFRELCGEATGEAALNKVSSKTNLYLKGGHHVERVGLDKLYTKAGETITFEPGRADCFEKHGSGCILSSALAGCLALGHSLPAACQKAKDYTERVLASNQSLLGYHNI